MGPGWMLSKDAAKPSQRGRGKRSTTSKSGGSPSFQHLCVATSSVGAASYTALRTSSTKGMEAAAAVRTGRWNQRRPRGRDRRQADGQRAFHPTCACKPSPLWASTTHTRTNVQTRAAAAYGSTWCGRLLCCGRAKVVAATEG